MRNTDQIPVQRGEILFACAERERERVSMLNNCIALNYKYLQLWNCESFVHKSPIKLSFTQKSNSNAWLAVFFPLYFVFTIIAREVIGS